MHLHLILSKWATLVFVLSLPSALLTLGSLTFFPLRSSKFLISFCMILQRWQWQIFIIIRWQNTTMCNNQVQSGEFLFSEHLWRTCYIYLTKKITFRSSVYKIQSIHKVHQLAAFQEVTLACSLINVTIIKSHQQCYIVHFVVVALDFFVHF